LHNLFLKTFENLNYYERLKCNDMGVIFIRNGVSKLASILM